MAATAVIPTVSLWHSVVYNVMHVLPAYSRGLFTPNKFWTGLWDRLQPDPAAVKFVSRLRKKYHSDYLYIHVLTKKSLLVLDPDGIRHVLDHSPDIYADAKLKRKGMSHFQPDAVTISRGEAWRDRRRFNESVLDSGQALHRHADQFLDIINGETRHVLQSKQLKWSDWADLFDQITLQVIFGKGIRDNTSLQALRQLMRQSNRGFGLDKSSQFDAFYDNIQRRRESAPDTSLAGLCKHAPVTEVTKPDNQIPHWMFAMADTLAINTARALALITSHSEAEQAVREEMAATRLNTAAAVRSLTYLRGCVQEAMRLWPTTPTLVRETLQDDRLGGAPVAKGTQVLILNSFNHRDREQLDFADRFEPQRWQQGDSINYRFNHLSNGAQVCAGKELALFMATAVLAKLLATHRFALQRPMLDRRKPLPYLYNHFKLSFSIRPI
ncbi:hypothetical protein Tel_08980 [Candidatus Tenderia electrophaga]|jgi:cytochrome P450|uniref:Cytochrome n=1 Tax=Candidatus Tenderia electrophaga TaxID=1748243 RepID=A0A0S2TDQ9_9GAMM|nr:hypothetical protein Tel_08980 [Candidatus Tenderia electrophaga]